MLLALGLAALVWGPLVAHYPSTPVGDGERFLHQIEVGKAAVRSGELPLWNPFDCLGIPLWDHPESLVVSPLLIALTPVDGLTTTFIWQIAHALAGFAGMWLLARRELRLGPIPTAFAATMWGFGATLTSQVGGAHFTFVSFWLVPWMLYLWRRAELQLWYGVALGAMAALIVYDGGTYPLPLSAVVLGLETLTRATPKRLPRITLAAAVVVAVAFGLGAARLLPLAEQFAIHKRTMEPDWDHLLRSRSLLSMFLWPQWRWWPRLPGQQYVWGEYIAFVGIPGLVLAGLGLVIALFRARWLWAVLIPCFWLMLGTYEDSAPWAILHEHVFPFTAMRVPSRFRIYVFMIFVLAGALAMDRIPAFLEARFPRWRVLSIAAAGALSAAALVTIVDTVILDQRVTASRAGGPPLVKQEPSPRFYYAHHDLARWPDQPRQNRAWLGCRQEFIFGWGAPLWVGDVPQVRSPDGFVSNATRTQGTFDFDIETTKPARVRLNSAFDIGWRASVGEVNEQGLLLVVDVPAGKHHVHMRYWPRRLTAGLTITGFTLACICVAAWLHRRRPLTTPSYRVT